MIVTVGNTKGGVGKTTLALNLAIARAMAGQDIWFVDGDRQGTAQAAIALRSEAPEPAPRGFRRPAPGADGSRGGRTPHRPAVRDACRDLATGPWRTARPGGDPPGVPRPIAASGPRSVASGGHFLVAGGCSCAAGSRRRAPAASTLREAVRGRWTVPQSDAGAIAGRRSSHHRYATIRNVVQVKKLTLGPKPAN